MLTPTTKPAPVKLIHHPSTVLDDLCAFDLTHEAWVLFDEKLTALLLQYEEAHRADFTPKAVRQSLGR
jgi:hypothetical protein